MHGNVYTWCQESYQSYKIDKEGEFVEDKEDVLNIVRENGRSLRGGSFVNHVQNVRCGYRPWYPPSIRPLVVGRRPARTFR
jgi:formylglycine-generating enzyme required for sulfatase activity